MSDKCVICKRPIIGYWHEIGKNKICQSCAASVTVYDLYMKDIVSIKPEIIDVEATLVTKEDEDMKNYLSSKQVPNAAYGMSVEADNKAAVEIAEKIEQGEIDGGMPDDTEPTLVTKDEEPPKVELDKSKLDDYPEATPEEVEKFFTSSEPAFNA